MRSRIITTLAVGGLGALLLPGALALVRSTRARLEAADIAIGAPG